MWIDGLISFLEKLTSMFEYILIFVVCFVAFVFFERYINELIYPLVFLIGFFIGTCYKTLRSNHIDF